MPRTRKNHPPSLKRKSPLRPSRAQDHRSTRSDVRHPPDPGRQLEEAALAGLPDVFSNGREVSRQQPTPRRTNCSSRSANSKWSWTFSKKELALSIEDRRRWIDPACPHLTVLQQCDLLSLPRSTYYYQPRPEGQENLRLLRQLDELYMERPYYGSRRMAVTLEVNRKRIQRLMRILGVEAIYPNPISGRPGPGHEIYPTCCEERDRPAQPGLEHRYYLHSDAWRLPYLVAVMDWTAARLSGSCPIHDGDQVKEAATHRNVGNIGAPDLVGPDDLDSSQQVG